MSVERNIAIVTLNRPSVRNAIDEQMALLLEAVVESVENTPQVRVAVIVGSDTAFCAGADLREVANGRLAATFTPRGGFGGFVDAQRKKPWIAAVNGAALAGGFEIVLACDLVVASVDARFGLPEVRRGLIASAGGLYRLPRSVPKAIALEIILTGQMITAHRAFELGMINRLTAPRDVLGEAMKLALAIGANAPLAVKMSLEIARKAAFFEDTDLRKMGDQGQDRLATTKDYKEGAEAFLQKRLPDWTGE
jgi:enoyl-CoA hydratase/carnithine racemase